MRFRLNLLPALKRPPQRTIVPLWMLVCLILTNAASAASQPVPRPSGHHGTAKRGDAATNRTVAAAKAAKAIEAAAQHHARQCQRAEFHESVNDVAAAMVREDSNRPACGARGAGAGAEAAVVPQDCGGVEAAPRAPPI